MGVTSLERLQRGVVRLAVLERAEQGQAEQGVQPHVDAAERHADAGFQASTTAA